jgi:hypothetical protein
MPLFNLQIYLRSIAHIARPKPTVAGPTDIFLGLVDHFEPSVGQPAREVAQARMQDWVDRYPQVAGRHRDADGRHPAHSFFYPWDEYDAGEMEQIVALCRDGWGELDLHLHHRDDTSDSLTEKFRTAIRLYASFGALPRWPDGRIAWGFIHGNWALDNSRSAHCGVNDELSILIREGCYADFTFPAWQHEAQPRQINSIYYATDDPARPKSYDVGQPAQVGGTPPPTDLLLIQGPLAPFVRRGRTGPRPAMDDGDLASYRRYSPERLDRWVRTGIHVAGRPDRIFIKLHTHGAPDANREALLGTDLDALFTDAERRYNDGTRYRLHYVSAREMFNIVKATESNAEISLTEARDFILKRPPYSPLPVS